jgi:cyclopropane fatty-acyl-phospholipid synthase-like methyltransferase
LLAYIGTTRVGKFEVWARILGDLGLRGDEQVLDLGCGRGAVLLSAAKLLPCGRAVGIDLWRPDQTGNSAEAPRAATPCSTAWPTGSNCTPPT